MGNRVFWSMLAWSMSGLFLLNGGCTSTVYRSKPGAGELEFQRDKMDCMALQRSAGLNEERIGKCLDAKGWEEVQTKPDTVEPTSPDTVEPTSDEEDYE